MLHILLSLQRLGEDSAAMAHLSNKQVINIMRKPALFWTWTTKMQISLHSVISAFCCIPKSKHLRCSCNWSEWWVLSYLVAHWRSGFSWHDSNIFITNREKIHMWFLAVKNLLLKLFTYVFTTGRSSKKQNTTSSRNTSRAKSGAATYKNTFQSEWTKEFPQIRRGSTNDRFWCKVCSVQLSCAHQGKKI